MPSGVLVGLYVCTVLQLFGSRKFMNTKTGRKSDKGLNEKGRDFSVSARVLEEIGPDQSTEQTTASLGLPT
jgi:hypothetical protein